MAVAGDVAVFVVAVAVAVVVGVVAVPVACVVAAVVVVEVGAVVVVVVVAVVTPVVAVLAVGCSWLIGMRGFAISKVGVVVGYRNSAVGWIVLLVRLVFL